MSSTLFEEQQKRRERRRAAEAKRWQKRLHNDPADLAALENLARLSCWSRRSRLARTYADRALKIFPFSTDALRWKGHSYLIENRYRMAERTFQEGLLINPYDKALYESFSTVYMLTNDRQKQLDVLYKAVKLFPDDPDCTISIGHALDAWSSRDAECKAHGTRQARRALSWYRRSVEIGPKCAKAWYWYGSALDCMERYRDAVAAFRRWAKLEPRNHRAWSCLGQSLADCGEARKAEAAYRRSIRLEPRDGDARYWLGILYLQRGELEKARSEYLALKRIDKDTSRLLQEIIHHKEAGDCRRANRSI